MFPVKRDDRILIETQSSEVYEGNVTNISKHSIELYSVCFSTTNTEYPGSLSFCNTEIQSLTQICDTSSSDEADSLNGNGNCADICKKLQLPRDEFNRLKKMTTQFILIDNFGKKFNDAIKALSNRERVAVAGLGNTFQRDKPLSLLLMSDVKQIYIFDMVCLIHLKDLKFILESEYITKVVHGGAALFDCLYHKYKVEMVNIFDIQLVDSKMSKTENKFEVTRNLPECLNYHFNLPLALFANVMEEMNDKTLQKRPMTKDNMIQASQLVAYLLPLRDHLTKKILSPYSDDTVQAYTPYMQDRKLLYEYE